ncbi:hypothetical protein DIPPA_31360 [Diplonema papillatum]|nr:hypothetical protein DIPPA_31360 [Diplonema papillatum]
MGHEAKSLLALLGKLLKGGLEDLEPALEVGTRLRELNGRARRGSPEFARTMRGRKQDPDREKAEERQFIFSSCGVID